MATVTVPSSRSASGTAAAVARTEEFRSRGENWRWSWVSLEKVVGGYFDDLSNNQNNNRLGSSFWVYVTAYHSSFFLIDYIICLWPSSSNVGLLGSAVVSVYLCICIGVGHLSGVRELYYSCLPIGSSSLGWIAVCDDDCSHKQYPSRNT